MSLFDYTIKELEAKLHNHEITVEDLVKESYAQIKKSGWRCPCILNT